MTTNKVFDESVITEKERADRLEAMVDRMADTIANLRGELYQANSLLRSANAVCTRHGAETNWAALGAQIEIALTRQHPILFK